MRFKGVVLSLCMVFLLAGCELFSGIGHVSDASYEPESGNAENGAGRPGSGSNVQRTIHIVGTRNMTVMEALAEEYCAEHPEVQIEFTVIGQTDLSAEIMTLAASNDLPDLFMQDQVSVLADSTDVVPVDDILSEADEENSVLMEMVREGMIRLYQSDGSDTLYSLPSEQNIEGFWYNKRIFEENNWQIPNTMDEFLKICEEAINAGIQPMAVSGENGFYLSRLWGGYINAEQGTAALKNAASGKLRWDDPSFLPAYEWLRGMYEKGYFGDQVINLSEDSMYDMLLSGRTAMIYSGSWIIRTLNSEDTEENFGFFGFPVPENGKGSPLNYCQNYGIPWMVAAKKYDPQLREFLVYAVRHYGDMAIEKQGILSGYQIKSQEDLPHYTQLVADLIKTAGEPAVWPEYKMSARQTTASYRLSEQLLLGEISPEEFGKLLEAMRE